MSISSANAIALETYKMLCFFSGYLCP
jgi:hypothetical protein